MARRGQEIEPSARTKRPPETFSVEDGWAPITGRKLTDTPPAAFRARWLAAAVCLAALVLALSLA